MNSLQKWLIVIAVLVFALGVVLNSFQGRYKMAVVDELSYKPGGYYSARFDTWTGDCSVKDSKSHRWVEGSSVFFKDLR